MPALHHRGGCAATPQPCAIVPRAGFGSGRILRATKGALMLLRRRAGVSLRQAVVGIVAVASLGLYGLAAAATFPMPKASGWAVWQAQQADREGAWEIGGPSGAGESYLQPAGDDASLLFPFESDRPATLRIRPMWWRNGEQKLSQRFPYPLVRQPGPDVVDYVGTTVFATAPAAGRVIAIDATTEKTLGFIEVGGYLTDLVADRDLGRIYVADALGDRVVGIDARSRRMLGTVSVPGGPWALALDKGRLFVACREAKKLLAFDTTTGDALKEVSLPAAPINLEVVEGPPARLVVRYQQQALDVFSLDPAPADRLQFDPVNQAGKPGPGCGGPDCKCNWYEVGGPHQLTHGGSVGPRKIIDVSAVTKGPVDASIAGRFGDNPGPISPVLLKLGEPDLYFLFFASPSRGLVGVLDKESKLLDPIRVGGYIADLREFGGKLYATDPAHDRVVVIDPKARRVEGEFPVPGGPWAMATVSDVAWQRPEELQPGSDKPIWPPAQVNRLYMTCLDSSELVAVDAASRQVVARTPLAGGPRGVTYAAPPNTGWWPVMADDRIPLAMQPRIAVELRPSLLDLTTLDLAPAPVETPPEAVWRDAVSVPAGAAAKRFMATNQLVIGVDGTRAIDISALADPQLMPDPGLTLKDAPGSITVSVDGGTEYDWAARRWIAPDSEMFLVNDSEEFWRYNAPALKVGPGRHVVRIRAHSPFARLEAVAVSRSPQPELEMTLLPEPQAVHGKVPLISYEGVFHDREPVLFTLQVANRGGAPVAGKASFSLTNYLGEKMQPVRPMEVTLAAGEAKSLPIALSPPEMGRFTLTVTVSTPEGEIAKEARFLRLPKLEHPRMFFRKEEIAAIQERIAQHPTLFKRYAEWLERMAPKEGRFPERFLPPGMTADDCAKAAPAEVTDPGAARNLCGWRNYELGWRALASELALNYLKPESAILKQKVAGLRAADKVDWYCEFHHHGPFFPGVDASLLDLSADPAEEAPKVYAQMTGNVGNMDVLPWTLVTLEEPLTPEKRALIYRIMTLENNAERYFETHRGQRGGPWWMNPYTWCHCPMHGYALMFMFLHNLFDEPRLFEKPVFAGFLTFQRYADPIKDKRALLPNVRGPNGEPWHWIFASLTRHPLEKSSYQWDEWIEKMDGPLAGDEQAAVDRLMALDGIALKGEMKGAANYFVSAVSVPMALALGWYDPKAPEVKWEEIPPTAVFEVEGWAAMRSGFDAKATEVSFVSGVRDHTSRNKPNHFTVVKAGQYLIGTPALLTDDGNMTGAWGNSIVVDDDWREQWAMNLQHPRDGEHLVINRFPPATFTYLGRDKLAFGFQAAEQGWGGGLDLHGHTETLFMQEGRLLAYQTWPGLDFAAGDAANAWPADKVSQLDRQLVFVKPDLVVVYDRVKLGPAGHASKWIAATGPGLTTQGDSFLIKAGSEHLAGRALLPAGATASALKPFETGWVWKDQQLLEIRPAAQSSQTEYLVVMRAGGAEPLPEMKLIQDERSTGVKLALGGREIEVRFNRSGPVGGSAAVTGNGRTDRYDLREAIVDSYANWRSDPRYEKWTREARFRFVMPSAERR